MQQNYLSLIKHFKTQAFSSLVLFVFLFASFNTVIAQNQFQVRNAIDSTSVKIGAVINYAIQVEENKDKTVIFPEGDSFAPLEVIESFKIDTLDELSLIHI